MTNDDNVVQLTEEDINKLSVNEQTKDNDFAKDESVSELEPHPEAKQKFELFRKYQNQKVVFKYMKLTGSNNVGVASACPEIIDVNEEKDTITFSKLYISSHESGTNTGVLYSDNVIIEHASWLDVKETVPPIDLRYTMMMGVDKTLILEE